MSTVPSDEPRERRQTGVAVSVALALWTLLFGPFLVMPGLPVYRDLLLTYLPLRHFWAERVSAGHLPGWFPYEGLGRAFIGQGITGTFHPVNLLYLALNDALALRVEIASAILVGVIGQVLLARQFRLSAAAAVAGAMVLALNGYSLSMTSNTAYLRGLCMLPWVALFATKVLSTTEPWAAVAGLATSWGLIPLGGDAASTLLAALVVATVALAYGMNRRVMWLGVSAMLAGLLAAPELLPASAQHEGSVVAAFNNAPFLSSYWALHPEMFPELMLPGFSPPGTVWTQAQALQETSRWAESVFLGVPVVALAFSAPRQRLPLGFLALGALGLWLAMGVHGGLELALRQLLPPLNSVRYPEKHLALAVMGFATAVAFGVERVTKSPRALFPGLFVAVLLALGLRVFLGPEGGQPALSSAANEATGAALAAAAGLGVVGWLLPRSHLAAWLLPLMLIATLWRMPLGLMTVPEEILSTAGNLPGSGRVWVERATRLSPLNRESLTLWAIAELNLLSGELGALRHRATFGLTGNLPLAPRRERTLLGWKLSDTRSLAPLFGYDLAMTADGSDVQLSAAPRAWVAAPRAVADPVELIRQLKADPAAAFAHPLVRGDLPPPAEGPVGAVAWVRDDIDELVLEARMTAPGLLVLNDLAADGWSVTVDGHDAQYLVSNALVRGVMLTAGTHRAVFSYEVPRLKSGLALGGVGLGSVLALLGLHLWRLRRATR